MPYRTSTVACLALMLSTAGAQAAIAKNTFNPQLSLLVQGQYADYSSSAEADIPGFLLGPETELKPRGPAIGEAELAIEANIDDAWHGWTTIAFENEDGETRTAVEELYVNTLALPHGLQFKLGRFFSDIGYHNRQHSHAWDFIDAPLAYRAFLATTYADDGAQLRWVAPADLLIEIGFEALRGAAFPGGGENLDGFESTSAFAHLGGDLGTGGSWRAGVSWLGSDAAERQSGEDEDPGPAFTGTSDTLILDLVYKWSPHGNATERSFKFQAEFFRRSEDGMLSDDGQTSGYAGEQTGAYVQAVYGFRRGWRAGVRYGWLTTDNTVALPATPALTALANPNDDRPSRLSFMVDYSRSEFSRFRLQYNHDRSRPDETTDEQIFLQYIFSLGSHPAHVF